ncbi:hypothetical protein BD309DRAFT_971165 [Dichomitus squalens]|nr:hypothetical protein BD309DRAFT_971165 [Dichomitus squalens]
MFPLFQSSIRPPSLDQLGLSNLPYMGRPSRRIGTTSPDDSQSAFGANPTDLPPYRPRRSSTPGSRV